VPRCASRNTGKERDIETGLDYFGARYHASSAGRWISPDPSNLGVDFWIPQSWNRYSHSLNNPLTWVDRNGLWPTWYHNQIIDAAFPGLSVSDRQNLKESSYVMDKGTFNGKSAQDSALSFMHGMSDGNAGENGVDAEARGDEFIAESLATARQAQADWEGRGNSGLSPLALQAFGNAIHVITDRTSPSHEGNQPWYGTKGSKNKLRAFNHFVIENTMSNAQLARAVNQIRQTFSKTFNPLLFAMAKASRVSCVTTPKVGGKGTETTCESY
jgi:RHS repeat-associated protein